MKNNFRIGVGIAFGALLLIAPGCGSMGIGSSSGGFQAMAVGTNEYGEERSTGARAASLFGFGGDEDTLKNAPKGSPESRWLASQDGGKNPENPANDGLCSAEAVQLNGQRQKLVKERQAMGSDNPRYSEVTQQVRDLTGKIRDAEVNFLDHLLNQQMALRNSLENRRGTEIDPSLDEQIADASKRINYLTGLRNNAEAIPSNYTALTMNPARIAEAVRANGGTGTLSSRN